ncbi:hypothetical protein KO494_12250 [Lacinutrix sp. C3R15]|uniref:hypothetical protein n=1 Tax=Flavobacteriaceae TaxID=49546 RepID=UPI001C0A246C|nr:MULTISPECIES: hypothetical protein [Flavobacteriaceae]MBU2940309.1 hypothetical protein [Lacinutrix sp. C3R15]MDO6623629.1 hypothetical protein [Oceanihabitans sp. 1_MG-2023]
MKSLKIASIVILSLFTFFSCDNEPLDGDFAIENEETELTCVEATQNLAEISETYAITPTDDASYAVICNDYAEALQNMITSCGDNTGALQSLLDSLNCPDATNSCTTAQAATDTAESAYQADATNTTLCNAYKTALQNEITQCGDADGSLQAIVDGLDCGTTNSEDLLLTEMIWTELDGTTYTDTFSYDGNKLTSITESGNLVNTYEYESDQLIRINSYEEDGSISDYVIPEYDADDKLISYVVYITNGNEGLKFDLTYNANGTITENKYSGDHVSQTNFLSETIITLQNDQIIVESFDDGTDSTYAYDTQNGMFKNISNLNTLNLINIDFSGYIDGGMNNLVSLTEDVNGNPVVYENYEYTYNSNNYPESSNDYIEGDLDTTREYIYE